MSTFFGLSPWPSAYYESVGSPKYCVSRLDHPARPRALLRFAVQVTLHRARTRLPRGGLLPG
jgi:hypothetical protein